MKTQAIARLLAQAAALSGLADLADKAAAEAKKGNKGPSWTKTLFKVKLNRVPTEEDLEKVGFESINGLEDANKNLVVEWAYADGYAGVRVGDETIDIEYDPDEFDDPKKVAAFHKSLEKAVNKLVALINK